MDNKEITSDSVKAPFIAQLRALTANIPMVVSSTTQSLHVNNSDQGEWKLTHGPHFVHHQYRWHPHKGISVIVGRAIGSTTSQNY